MSYLTEDPSTHDLILGGVIRHLLQSLPEASLLASDGGIPFSEAVSTNPPILGGYRGDALLGTPEGLYVIEAKSVTDLNNPHALSQFYTLTDLMKQPEVAGVILVVFGVQDESFRSEPPIDAFLTHEKAILFSTPVAWRAQQ